MLSGRSSDLSCYACNDGNMLNWRPCSPYYLSGVHIHVLSRPLGRLFFLRTWDLLSIFGNAEWLVNSRKTLLHSSGEFANFRVF